MNSNAVRQIIEEGNRKFGAAAADKDYAGMAAFYTDDAKLLPPDAPIVSGRKAIEEAAPSACIVQPLAESNRRRLNAPQFAGAAQLSEAKWRPRVQFRVQDSL